MILPSLSAALVLSLLVSCTSEKKIPMNTPTVSGGRSAILTIDPLIVASMKTRMQRNAALLGIFVSEYISFAQTAQAAQGALNGIAVDRQIMESQTTVTDPDFDLLQAFGSALQVDTADLLNRSTDRQQTLDTYVKVLTNAAKRANERFQQLSGTLDELKKSLRAQGKERSEAERELKDAIRKKDISEA